MNQETSRYSVYVYTHLPTSDGKSPKKISRNFDSRLKAEVHMHFAHKKRSVKTLSSCNFYIDIIQLHLGCTPTVFFRGACRPLVGSHVCQWRPATRGPQTYRRVAGWATRQSHDRHPLTCRPSLGHWTWLADCRRMSASSLGLSAFVQPTWDHTVRPPAAPTACRRLSSPPGTTPSGHRGPCHHPTGSHTTHSWVANHPTAHCLVWCGISALAVT
jgi:hypothetical protein